MNSFPLPRLRFAHLPTPVEPMPRLSAVLGGPQLWVKRDDQTGLALGGNKTRKLEFLVADAQANGARTLITWGAAQSNHCRQTAAAAARFGFDCTLVLAGRPPASSQGNTLLGQLLGARIVWAEDRDPPLVQREIFEQAWAEGKRPYAIPYGGSNATGASAYVAAMKEFLDQGVPVDHILFATSSGGTQAGLIVGARQHGFQGRVLGISVDKPAPLLKDKIASLANEVATTLRLPAVFHADDVEVNDAYLGAGYGVMGSLERSAIETFARHEGLLLDPVYTARAAGGMMDLIHRGEFTSGERVLFWHTGGTPALFAYSGQLQ